MRVFIMVIVGLLLVPLGVSASDSGVVIRSCDMLKEPFRDASPVQSLEKGETVGIQKRKGGWLQVSVKKTSGWVRMFCIRRGPAGTQPSVAKEASGVLGLATGRAGSGNVVAATGVRGLDEEQLKEAEYNAQELQRLKTFVTSATEAKAFAKQGKLQVQSVPYIEPIDGK